MMFRPTKKMNAPTTLAAQHPFTSSRTRVQMSANAKPLFHTATALRVATQVRSQHQVVTHPLQHRSFGTAKIDHEVPEISEQFKIPLGLSPERLELLRVNRMPNRFYEDNYLYAIYDRKNPPQSIIGFCRDVIDSKAMLLTFKQHVEKHGGELHLVKALKSTQFEFVYPTRDLWNRHLHIGEYHIRLKDVEYLHTPILGLDGYLEQLVHEENASKPNNTTRPQFKI